MDIATHILIFIRKFNTISDDKTSNPYTIFVYCSCWLDCLHGKGAKKIERKRRNKRAIDMAFTYDYPRMLVTVDALVFLKEASKNYKILLIERKNNPYKGHFALPGGFVDMDETLKDAATRELQEETGLQGVELHQLYAFDAIDRDPRGRNLCVAFYGITSPENSKVTANDDAEKAQWFDINNLPRLAFDHSEIVQHAIKKLGF